MKKLIIIILLFSAVSYSQDTCKKYQGSMKGNQFIVTDTVYFICDTAKIKAGGMKGQDTNQIKAEALKLVNEKKEIVIQIYYLKEQLEAIEIKLQQLQQLYNEEKKK